jgi:hypothetical protein
MARDEVTVRMYRGILGDCFLVRHHTDKAVWSMLIDCGVLQGVKGGKDRIRAIARDVINTCGGRLDLVVVTHDHADHNSGFCHAREMFFGDRVEIRKLWLAWTENDQDELAKSLRLKFAKANKALALTSTLGLDQDYQRDQRIKRVAGLQGFIAFEPDEAAPASATLPPNLQGRWNGRRVFDELKSKAGTGNVDYLSPGDIRRTGVDERLRAYVLGPPRDEARLRKDAPSGGAVREVYLASANEAKAVASGAKTVGTRLPATAGAMAELTAADPPDPPPFAGPHQRDLNLVEEDIRHAPLGGVERLYYSRKHKARRIEDDWLDAAESLALKMDSDTNNTSLVLAIELPNRQVLLFAGDAQVGNWLSWGDRTYPPKQEEGQPPPILVEDLLSRVTLYKVGHHASHNATLRDRGLERMTDRRLTAMIPVVEDVAKQQGKGWRMPYPDLEDRLLAKTEGRVLRGDDDNIRREKGAFRKSRHQTLKYEQPSGGGLWVEVTIPAN